MTSNVNKLSIKASIDKTVKVNVLAQNTKAVTETKAVGHGRREHFGFRQYISENFKILCCTHRLTPNLQHSGDEIDIPTGKKRKDMSSVKLVPIKIDSGPNQDDDEVDAGSDTPMMGADPSKVAPGDENEEEKPSDELKKSESTGILDKITNKLDQVTDVIGQKVSTLINDEVPDDISVVSDEPLSDYSLHQAVGSGSLERLQLVIRSIKSEARKDIIEELKLSNAIGYTPVHIAARNNYKDIIVCLLDISTTIIDQPGGEEEFTPLHIAAKYDMVSAAKCLLARGADGARTNRYGSTALHFAARRGNLELCQLLLDSGNVTPNVTDHAELTPLHSAMMGGNEAVVKCLIDADADPNAEDNEGERPIHFAAAENQADLIVLLTKGALRRVPEDEREACQREFVNAKSGENDTALHIAAQAGYEETVKTLISIGANVNPRTDTRQTPLHLAAISGQLSVVKYLIMHGAKVNAVDDQQDTPLHKACQFGRLDTVKYLLGNGAKIDMKDNENFTPLLSSVWKGQNEVMKFLLESKANPRVTDINMKNVFHLAIEEDWDETLRLLIETLPKMDVPIGLLINAVDKDYQAPLHYAANMGNEEAIQMLLDKNAKVDIGDNEEKTPIHIAAKNGKLNAVKLLGEAAPGIINSTDDRGQSPLHIAALNGHKRVCNALIEMGAETSGRDDVNWTPLDYAAYHGHWKTVKLLLDNDAPVDAIDKNCRTPLHHASLNGHIDCIKILLDYGASISRQDRFGRNCLELAVENFQRDACMAFITHKRWREALKHLNNDGFHPMEKLIEFAPDVAEIVLDNSITYSKEGIKHKNYTIHYDFQYFNIDPEEQINKVYFAPENMVRHKRDKLISHPLIVKLIDVKFARLARWIYYINLMFYLLFLSLLTALLVIDKERMKDTSTRSDKNSFQEIVPWFTLIMAVLQLIKELGQVYLLRRHYFKDPVNYLEVILYVSTITFMGPFLAQNFSSIFNNSIVTALTGDDFDTLKHLEAIKWNAGALAILLAWSNLLLYLKRFPSFGLYVVMFVEVLKTVVSVLSVFSIFIIAFALSFFVLLDKTDQFRYAGRAIAKTCVMTIGEFEYSDIFTTNMDVHTMMPYKVVTFLIFVLFLIMMPILIMNLLVGLAIGDIEAVRTSAYLRVLKAQVRILYTLESQYPKWLLGAVYARDAQHKPNERRWWKILLGWLVNSDYESVKDEQNQSSGKADLLMKELVSNREELDKQKKRMKALIELLEDQVETTKLVAEKLGLEEDD